jgi:hypothetical protein
MPFGLLSTRSCAVEVVDNGHVPLSLPLLSLLLLLLACWQSCAAEAVDNGPVPLSGLYWLTQSSVEPTPSLDAGFSTTMAVFAATASLVDCSVAAL